jgi:hypothetical protein
LLVRLAAEATAGVVATSVAAMRSEPRPHRARRHPFRVRVAAAGMGVGVMPVGVMPVGVMAVEVMAEVDGDNPGR